MHNKIRTIYIWPVCRRNVNNDSLYGYCNRVLFLQYGLLTGITLHYTPLVPIATQMNPPKIIKLFLHVIVIFFNSASQFIALPLKE